MKKLLTIIVVLLGLTAIGTAWFWLVEGWSLLDAAYMTVITLSTVGYQEVNPLTDRGRIFVMLFLICGLGVFFYAIVQLGEIVVRAELRTWLRRRGMNAALKSMKDHYIVCGYGRMGRAICQYLSERKLPFVVVDIDEVAITDCEQNGWHWVHDDATSDRTLLDAGIPQARGLAVVLDSDADNLYVVLSARLISPDLQIIARAVDENSARKMEKAGANRVVSLYNTGATKIATLLVNPQVEDLFEIVSETGPNLDLAEIRVSAESPYANLALSETDFRHRGVIVVAIRRSTGEILLPPSESTVILPDDELIALGKGSAVARFLSNEATPQ